MPRQLLSKILKRPDAPYLRPSLERTDSVESIASDATAPNNPGPGRNVGRLYDSLGSRFERFLNRTAWLGGNAEQVRESRLQVQLFRMDTIDTIASDATAPNLPGPGRNLGRLYDAVGERIEHLLNSRAGRLKLGPDALAEAIRCLRRYEEGAWGRQLAAPTDKEYDTLKKPCQKLLKHCKSHVLATQLTALNEVTALAIEDPYVRQILAGVLHDSYLIPKYKERELHVSSSKAVISIKDNEAHEFWERFMHKYLNSTTYDASKWNDPDVSYFRNQLMLHLRDPDISFLLGRLLLTQFTSSANANAFLLACGSYVKTATMNPHVIEWDTLSKVFTLMFMKQPYDLMVDSAKCIMQLARNFPVLQLYGGASPSYAHPRERDKVDLQALLVNSHWITKFLHDLCMSNDLLAQLWCLRNLDAKARESVQQTAFGKEILLAYARVHHATSCDVCTIQPVRGTESYRLEATVMLHYYLHGIHEERILAKAVIYQSMEFTRYFKYTFRALVSQHSDNAQLVDLPPVSRESITVTPTAWHANRHCIRRRQFFVNNNVQAGANGGMDEDDILVPSCGYVPESELLFWLEVDGDEHPLDVIGHFPILAGLDTLGKDIYVARIDSYSGYTYISDGARNVSFTDRRGREKVASRFEVMVLKHDPCDVGVQRIPGGAKFQTGPVYWIHREDVGECSDSESEAGSDSESSGSWGSESDEGSETGSASGSEESDSDMSEEGD